MFAIPKYRLITYVCVGIFAMGYLIWSIWPKPVVISSERYSKAKPLVTSKKIEGPVLKVPLKVIPKKKLPEELDIDATEEAVDSTSLPPTENGITTVTVVDTNTGEFKTLVKEKESPLFAFENKNTFGVGYEVSTEGSRIVGYYKRDLVRVKDLHLVGKIEGKFPVGVAGNIEGNIGGYLEYRK